MRRDEAPGVAHGLQGNTEEPSQRLLVQLAEALPADVKVLSVADRGVGDDEKSAAGSWGRADQP